MLHLSKPNFLLRIMKLSYLLRSILSCIVLSGILPATAAKVYFDNYSTKWETPHVYYYGGGVVDPGWSGPEMSEYQGGIWQYDVPDAATHVIFSNNGADQTGDLEFKHGHVYTKASGDCGTLEDYLLEPELPVDGVYTIWFYAPSDWTRVNVWVWDEADGDKNYTGGTWPGKQIYAGTSAEHPELYCFTFTCANKNARLKCIFSTGSDGANQTDDLKLFNGHVYSQDGTHVDYDEYGVYDPSTMTDYRIWFDNRRSWKNVKVDIAGSGFSQTLDMSSNLNSSMYACDFSAPEGVTLTCSFYWLDGSTKTEKTGDFKVVNNHVYTVSGDRGDYSSYTPSTLPEADVWFEPTAVSQKQSLIMYFNKNYKSDSNLKNTQDIYLWVWLVPGAGSEKVELPCSWSYQLNNQDVSANYKMTCRTDLDPSGGVYSFTFDPTLAGWFNAPEDGRYTQLGYIIRDKSGNTNYFGDDKFFDLIRLPDPSAGVGAYVSHKDTGNEVVITCEEGVMTLTPMSADVVKVFPVRNDQAEKNERRTVSVVSADDPDYAFTQPSYEVNSTDDALEIAIEDGVRVRFEKQTGLLSFLDVNGIEYLRELSGLNNKRGNVSVAFAGMYDDGFYGGGYNGNHINWDGRGNIVMNNRQTGGWYQGSTNNKHIPPHNICVPFYISTRGYGVYFDDHYQGATLNLSSNGSTYSSASQNPIAYYFIGGGEIDGDNASMERVMEGYTRLTGLQPLPPYWALGYITSRYGYRNKSQADEEINGIKNHETYKIPLDGIVFDLYWQGDATKYMGRLEWDTNSFPNPTAMLKEYKDKGIGTIVITEPYFTEDTGDNYTELNTNGYFANSATSGMTWLTNRNVGLIDPSNEDAMSWMGEFYKKHTKAGMSGWWLDLGEPESHPTDGGCHHKGGSCAQIHNEFGQLWIAAAWKAVNEAEPEMRHILLPRSGTSGMQRYGTFPWTGDIKRAWGGLQAQVPALVSASMSGIGYLGSDIGGFSEPDGDGNERLYLRWVQLGVFYPAMRTHSQDWIHLPEPKNWPGVHGQVRDAINLRYAYLPYTYSQSYSYSRYGTPIARPANFSDTEKSTLANSIDSYLWGPDLFVAPVLSDATTRSITFPEGEWLDMNDWNSVYEGHRNVSYNAPLEKLPRFMRRGSFITRYRQDTFENTSSIETSKLTVDYFADYSGAMKGSRLYDDDHTSVNPFKKGEYLATTFAGRGSRSNDNLEIAITRDPDGQGWEGMYESQDVLLQIHDFQLEKNGFSPASITFYAVTPDEPQNGPQKEVTIKNDFTQSNSLENLKSATTGSNSYYLDEENNKLYLRMPALSPKASYVLTVGSGGGFITDVERPAALATMTLSYAGGCFNYSAPEGTRDLRIDVYTPAGALVCGLADLEAVGHVCEVEAGLGAGIYIARLSGSNSAGESDCKTIKIVVR